MLFYLIDNFLYRVEFQYFTFLLVSLICNLIFTKFSFYSIQDYNCESIDSKTIVQFDLFSVS